MGILVRDGSVWKDSEPYVKDSGIWKPVDTGYTKDGGVWKEFYASGFDPSTPLGTFIEGGYYAGLIQVGAVTYALIVAPKALGEKVSGTLTWKTSQTTTTGTSSVNDGWANTQAMATAGLANHPAANFCRGLTIGGYSDWYLPARDELEILYRNFKPTTWSNHTGGHGANSSSVPPQGIYALNNPTQTSIALFKVGGAEAFQDSTYLSSTEYSSSGGWVQHFMNGFQGDEPKTTTHGVRAVRRVPASI